MTTLTLTIEAPEGTEETVIDYINDTLHTLVRRNVINDDNDDAWKWGAWKW